MSLAIGGIIGSLAGYGHIQSAQIWDQKKHIAALENQVEDLKNRSAAYSSEAEIAWSYSVTELTVEDLREQEYYDSLEMLAQLVEAEAGNQSLEGKRLVVDVVLNRVASDDFPDTIAEVINQTNQFACMSDGGFERAGWRMQDEDYKAVLLELEERLNYDILYFTAEAYGKYGTPAFREGDHYFSYE